ncbi:hypothetical protein WJX72_001499 [[Myrmecia] bisecta]|uniref:Mechanosensitive ion channel MscS domain-containing protein n=1 Tax=[Myrmecia] bisecta TaxID=41462 RepID=A0AAW1QPA5_9CHLO
MHKTVSQRSSELWPRWSAGSISELRQRANASYNRGDPYIAAPRSPWGGQGGAFCQASFPVRPFRQHSQRPASSWSARSLLSVCGLWSSRPLNCPCSRLGKRHASCRARYGGPELDVDAFVDSYDSDEYEWEDEDFLPVARTRRRRRFLARAQQQPASSRGSSKGAPQDLPLPNAQQVADAQQDQQWSSIRGQVTETTLARLAAVGLWLWHALLLVPKETVLAVKVTLAGAAGMMRSTADAGVQRMASQADQARLAAERSAAAKERASASIDEADDVMPDDLWGRLQYLWDRPPVKRLRLTISMAQWSVRLPALLALLATQVGLLASQVSLPMLAPLLLGTGMLLRSIKQNASYLFPRLGVVVVLLWAIWFANSVIQSTAVYLRRQGAVDHRVSGAIITTSECVSLLSAAVCILSMLGINVSGLLLPAGIALAFAAKDLSHNFLAGFFLFAVQPFKLGDRVAVSYSSPAAAGMQSAGWFEGTCEKVDLRYTIIKDGARRLYMPNSAFITREFIVLEDPGKELAKRGAVERRTHIGHGKLVGQSRYPPSGRDSADWGPSADAWRGQRHYPHDAQSAAGDVGPSRHNGQVHGSSELPADDWRGSGHNGYSPEVADGALRNAPSPSGMPPVHYSPDPWQQQAETISRCAVPGAEAKFTASQRPVLPYKQVVLSRW